MQPGPAQPPPAVADSIQPPAQGPSGAGQNIGEGNADGVGDPNSDADDVILLDQEGGSDKPMGEGETGGQGARNVNSSRSGKGQSQQQSPSRKRQRSRRRGGKSEKSVQSNEVDSSGLKVLSKIAFDKPHGIS